MFYLNRRHDNYYYYVGHCSQFFGQKSLTTEWLVYFLIFNPRLKDMHVFDILSVISKSRIKSQDIFTHDSKTKVCYLICASIFAAHRLMECSHNTTTITIYIIYMFIYLYTCVCVKRFRRKQDESSFRF